MEAWAIFSVKGSFELRKSLNSLFSSLYCAIFWTTLNGSGVDVKVVCGTLRCAFV